MDLTKPGEEREEGRPYTDEEDDDKDEYFPVLQVGAPQEGPVLSVRLDKGKDQHQRGTWSNRTHPAQPIIAQHQREQEPQHKLTTEQRVVEVRNLRRCLSVVLCIQVSPMGQNP